MAKDLTHEVFQDKPIFCRKDSCRKLIGHQKLDGQLLVLANGLIVFNYLCWKCDCGKAASWLAPNLPGEKAEAVPDVGDILHRSLSVKERAQKLGYKAKMQSA